MKTYGLIGQQLAHSFSKTYFERKFKSLKCDCTYLNYKLSSVSLFDQLPISEISGLNVTTPYKESIIEYLDTLNPLAMDVGAVNTIKIVDNKTIGYNTDVYGFQQSLRSFLPEGIDVKALVLGSGGASKAVQKALELDTVEYQVVSRFKGINKISYQELDTQQIKEHLLIINTTPLGMYPQVSTTPPINFGSISKYHYCYDLIYNPETTLFLKNASDKGAATKNGLEMLQLQADKSWQIWNE